MDADAKGTAKLVGSPKGSRPITANFRTEEIRGYLFKKTRDGKWQKRWFETNGCFLTYYKKQGQKLLAALNLPQVGSISLLQEDAAEGPGLFTIELNERVYTIKARSHEEAAFWVDALLWRQAGGVVTQKSPDVNRVQGISAVSEEDLDSLHRSGTSVTASTSTAKTSAGAANTKRADSKPASSAVAPPEEDVKNGACAACCTVQ